MAFDGLVMKALLSQLADSLTGGKIEKIYQPTADELVLNIHTREGRRRLCISSASSHACLYLTDKSFENPAVPPNFCMLLRKHIGGGRIVGVRQRESERIAEIDIETLSELGFTVNKRLIAEIMGKHSNIVLLDCTTGKIIDSIKRISIDVNRIRQLLPGKLYEYPPTQNKTDFMRISSEDCRAITKKATSDNLSKVILSSVMGISPAIAEGLAARCESQAGKLLPESGALLYDMIGDMQRAIRESDFTPAVYTDAAGAPMDFHIFPLHFREYDCRKLTFDTVSEMTEYYFSNKAGIGQARQKSAELEKTVRAALQRLYLKKQRLCEDLLAAENSEELRLFGELLTANIHSVKPGASEATLINYYDGSEVKIPLDVRYTPAKNAQLYYKKYGKAHTAVKEKTLRLEETEQDIKYLESVAGFIENAVSSEEIEEIRSELTESGYVRRRKTSAPAKKTKPAPYEYRSPNGLRILAGRNNKENDYLTFKLAGSRDIWFHTKDIPGSHVILFTEGLPLDDVAPEDIFAAAGVAAWHSKGRESENVPVDYTIVKYVKKPGGAKPGMVIFTNNRTVWINPLLP